MKKLLIFALLGSAAFAQSVSQTFQQSGSSGVYVVVFNWTAGTSGTVPTTQAILNMPSNGGPVSVAGYRIISAETVPGSPAPTNGYNVTLPDQAGVDLLAGGGDSQSSSSPAAIVASPTAPPLIGGFSLAIAGNAVSGAKGTVYVYIAAITQVLGLSPTNPSFPAQGQDLFYAAPCGSGGSPGFRAPCSSDALVYSFNGRQGAVSPTAGDYTCAQITNCTASGVTSFNSRTGAVVPTTGDYTCAQVTNCGSFVAPFFNVSAYNYAAQTPGGSLSAGTGATVTLSPCPVGIVVSGSYQTPMYVSGGTGTAEVVTLTGGSCTSGAGSGTVTFTPANNHTGAWTVVSATGGLQEGFNYSCNNYSSGSTLMLGPSATTLLAEAIVPQSCRVTLTGLGNSNELLVRGSTYANGDLIFAGSTGVLTIMDLAIVNGVSGGQSSGAAIHFQLNGDICRNVTVYGGYIGYWYEATATGNATNCGFADLNNHAAEAVLISELSSNHATPSTDTHWTGSYFYGPSNGSGIGMKVTGTDSLTVMGNTFGIWDDQMFVEPDSGGAYVSTLKVLNNTFDEASGYGMYIENVNSAALGLVVIANNTFTNEQSSGSLTSSQAIDFCIAAPGGSCYDATITGNVIQGWGYAGIGIGATATGQISIIGNNVTLNNARNAAGVAEIGLIGSTTSHVVIEGNTLCGGGTYDYYGVYVVAASSHIAITGNDISTCATGTIETPNLLTLSTIGNNLGVDDVIPSVASAATLAIPINPSFTITGTTGVSAVSGLYSAGQKGTFITTGGAVAFSSGATIGNSCTTTQNKPYTYMYDGTHFWIAGSGC